MELVYGLWNVATLVGLQLVEQVRRSGPDSQQTQWEGPASHSSVLSRRRQDHRVFVLRWNVVAV